MNNSKMFEDLSGVDKSDTPNLYDLCYEFEEISNDTTAFSSFLEILSSAVSAEKSSNSGYNAAIYYISNRMHGHALRMETALNQLWETARNNDDGGTHHDH